MRLAGKLDEWQAAGLIDAPAAAAILVHEEARARPVATFAVAGLGLLALALGIVSVVAANWDALPPALKLSGHLVLLAAAAAAVIPLARRGRVWAGEGTLFLLAALTLAGIALHSQVYQLTGALWQALAWWALLLTPALLLFGRTRLTAYGYGLMLAALAIAWRSAASGWLGDSLTMALAPLVVLAALVLSRGAPDATFRVGLFEIGFAAALIGASVAQVGWGLRLSAATASGLLAELWLAGIAVAATALLVFRRRAPEEAWLVAGALGGAFVAVVLVLGIPHGGGPADRLTGALVFAALWGGVAALATRAGWYRLFRIAVALLAFRLFVVYFELFYSLAFTGLGLIVAGLLLMALAWGWARIVRAEAR